MRHFQVGAAMELLLVANILFAGTQGCSSTKNYAPSQGAASVGPEDYTKMPLSSIIAPAQRKELDGRRVRFNASYAGDDTLAAQFTRMPSPFNQNHDWILVKSPGVNWNAQKYFIGVPHPLNQALNTVGMGERLDIFAKVFLLNDGSVLLAVEKLVRKNPAP